MDGEREIPKPWAGINGQRVTQEIAEAIGLSRPRGILINLVDSRSGFADAEIEAGDVILAVDGHPVHTRMDLIYRMLIRGPGADATIAYLREDKELEADIELALAPLDPLPEPRRLGRSSGAFAGAEVAHASPALAVGLGVPSVGIRGVIVVSVDGPAARWLRPGDLIRRVGERRIRTVSDLADSVRGIRERTTVLFERDGRRLRTEIGR